MTHPQEIRLIEPAYGGGWWPTAEAWALFRTATPAQREALATQCARQLGAYGPLTGGGLPFANDPRGLAR